MFDSARSSRRQETKCSKVITDNFISISLVLTIVNCCSSPDGGNRRDFDFAVGNTHTGAQNNKAMLDVFPQCHCLFPLTCRQGECTLFPPPVDFPFVILLN